LSDRQKVFTKGGGRTYRTIIKAQKKIGPSKRENMAQGSRKRRLPTRRAREGGRGSRGVLGNAMKGWHRVGKDIVKNLLRRIGFHCSTG